MDSTTTTGSEKEKILKATAADESLQELIKLIKNGFPKTSTRTPDNSRQFYKFKDYLSTHDGLIFYQDRTLIPYSMRKDMRMKLHQSHLAIDSNMRRAWNEERNARNIYKL